MRLMISRRMIITVMSTVTIRVTVTIISTTSIAIMTITTAIPMLMTANKPPRPRRRAAPATAGPGLPLPGSNPLPENEAAALYRLMTWLSPSFPVGAFSYSSGIEWAVEAGDISDPRSLEAWLDSMLRSGRGFAMAYS